MTRLLPCFTVAVATATATTTRVTMDDEPAFFAAALARDDAAARWRAEASAANVRALGVAPGRVVLLFAAPALSEEARALAALGYRVEAYDLVGDEAADVELRLFDRGREPRARALGKADPAHGRRGGPLRRPHAGGRGGDVRLLQERVGAAVAGPRALPRSRRVRLRAAPRAYATLTLRRREPPQVTDTSASLFYVEVMRDLIAKGLPGGFDACDAALYADEPKLMHKYTRGDGGVVYEYYARENAQSETVCGARCFVRERFTHVNITDVALEGTTESTRREAPGVAEREGPCAALCPGG